ncbi:MAG: type II toxin-antitoxin system HicA family toxin [Candidatus Thorarchaeota archaeon]
MASRKLVRKLPKNGFVYAVARRKESHVALGEYNQSGRPHFVIIPYRNPIPTETLLSIIRQNGLSKEKFIRILQ